jgi:cyclophilin family peptidyl-prolyl cis-trans isomerase
MIDKNLDDVVISIHISNYLILMSKKDSSVPVDSTHPSTINKAFTTVLLLVFLSGFAYYGIIYLPYLLDQTTDAKEQREIKKLEDVKAAQDKRKADRNANVLKEDPANLVFTDRTAVMTTNFGDISIKLQDKAAPKTSESFIRLTSRKYFDKTEFHRIVKTPNFTVIQGGDPLGNGTGGESAFGTPLPDEIYSVKPEPATDGTGGFITEPKFVDDSLYTGLDKTKGTVEYRKGLIIMANRGADTGGSQFFITLDKTVLPASYTIFGVIDESSFSVLGKINQEVGIITRQPTAQQQAQGQQPSTTDGQPDRELYIEKVILK